MVARATMEAALVAAGVAEGATEADVQQRWSGWSEEERTIWCLNTTSPPMARAVHAYLHAVFKARAVVVAALGHHHRSRLEHSMKVCMHCSRHRGARGVQTPYRSLFFAPSTPPLLHIGLGRALRHPCCYYRRLHRRPPHHPPRA